MKPTAEETHLTRWIDGELSDEEAADLLRGRPGWRDEAAFASALGDRLRAVVSVEQELPYADFFSHQIRRRIEGGIFSDEPSPDREEEAVESTSGPAAFSMFQRLRWMAGAGFLVTLGALVAFVVNQAAPADRSEVVSTYTPDPRVSVNTAYHPEAGATVIHLIGAPSSPPLPSVSALSDPVPGAVRGRVIFRLDSRAIGRPVSVLARGTADEMPGTLLVGF